MFHQFGRLNYENGLWQGEDETYLVRMDDAVLQRHRRVYLEHLGIPTQTQTELAAYAQDVLMQQYDAFQPLCRIASWHTCTDPDVTILEKKWGKVWRPRQ